jgi:Uma2 family endonuclease
VSLTVTFEEFQQIPDPPGGRYELFHGELVEVPNPNGRHIRAQWRLRRGLEHAAGVSGVADGAIPFRPLAEYEGWRADVAFIFIDRWESIDPNGHLMGAPDLVVEIRSPSNTQRRIEDRERICLGNGASSGSLTCGTGQFGSRAWQGE